MKRFTYGFRWVVGVAAVVLALQFLIVLRASGVQPPAVKRKQIEEMDARAQARVEAKRRRSHCRYGWDEGKGKCYEPKEGQLYRDPKTGEMKMKPIEKVNLPWN